MKRTLQIIAIIFMINSFQSANGVSLTPHSARWRLSKEFKRIIPGIHKKFIKNLFSTKSILVCVTAGITLYGFSRFIKSKTKNSTPPQLGLKPILKEKILYKNSPANLSSEISGLQKTNLAPKPQQIKKSPPTRQKKIDFLLKRYNNAMEEPFVAPVMVFCSAENQISENTILPPTDPKPDNFTLNQKIQDLMNKYREPIEETPLIPKPKNPSFLSHKFC